MGHANFVGFENPFPFIIIIMMLLLLLLYLVKETYLHQIVIFIHFNLQSGMNRFRIKIEALSMYSFMSITLAVAISMILHYCFSTNQLNWLKMWIQPVYHRKISSLIISDALQPDGVKINSAKMDFTKWFWNV